MHDIKYSNVNVQLQAAIPELNDQFEKEAWVINDPEGPRQYLVIELILNPLLRELLERDSERPPLRRTAELLRQTVPRSDREESDRNLLARIFEFFERMATSSDPEVPNLLAVGVFEQLVNQPKQVRVAWSYMGSETKKLAREVARGLLREHNLPKSG